MNNNILSLNKNIDNNECPNGFYLETLSIKNFRNHSSLSMKMPESSILIYGENGCGKTNILEAISLLSQGKGMRISWITPQMCILFQSGMSERRRFIDSLTSSLDTLHLSRVYKYKKLLRERSNIILQFNTDATWLSTIESQISELAVAIIASRLDLVQALNDLYIEEYENKFLTDNFPPVEIKLKGKIEDLLFKNSALEVEDYVKLILKKSRFNNDVSICGPHTSEIEILNRKSNKHVEISSTGEQKLILISIILSHARMLNIKFNMAPILLLDDIVEHLDEKHRIALYQEVTRHSAQSWFTSTSKEAFKKYPNTIDKIYLPRVLGDLKGYYDFKMEKIQCLRKN